MRAFLAGDGSPDGLCGQRGRQRAILREGVYAINLALFVVISEDGVYRLALDNRNEARTVDQWRLELAASRGFDPVVVGVHGKKPTIDLKGTVEPTVAEDNIAIVTVHDGLARPGRDHRSGGRMRAGRSELPQQLSRHRGVSSRGRQARLAVHPPRRRHVFYQPLVCHRRADSQDDRSHWVRRRGGQLLRQAGPGPVRPGVSPWRAGGRRLPRRAGPDALPRQVSVQYVCGPGQHGADHQLRAPLDHGPDRRNAPLRRDAQIDRPGDGRRLRAGAAAFRGGTHRLRKGAQRGSAVRRHQEADHADPRPNAQRLLPRHRSQEEHARTAARPRPDPAGVAEGIESPVRRVRHRAGRRIDRQTGDPGVERRNRDPPATIADAATLARADRNLRAATRRLPRSSRP